MKLVVDGLETEYGHHLEVERLNIGDGVGRQVHSQLKASGVPALVLFDAGGKEVYRSERKLLFPATIRRELERVGVQP